MEIESEWRIVIIDFIFKGWGILKVTRQIELNR